MSFLFLKETLKKNNGFDIKISKCFFCDGIVVKVSNYPGVLKNSGGVSDVRYLKKIFEEKKFSENKIKDFINSAIRELS